MAKRRPAGDGMVRKRDDGRWEGRIVIGHRENGEPLFRHVYAKTQKALLDKLHQNIECYLGIFKRKVSQHSFLTLSSVGKLLARRTSNYNCWVEGVNGIYCIFNIAEVQTLSVMIKIRIIACECRLPFVIGGNHIESG